MLRPRAALLLLLTILSFACLAQDAPDKAGEVINFPSRFFDHIQRKTSSLDNQLTRQTEKYLERMAKREARLQKRLSKSDSAAAKIYSQAVPNSTQHSLSGCPQTAATSILI